ncbi:Nodulin-like [Trypanosoma melophagium]|uniref:Nodulin-like n=1 Tax=Trypanosoma melophagium TaxID=715481 RepID=UPI00351A6BF3|nr:Nodulin-like [Trypanosoma melophagium]
MLCAQLGRFRILVGGLAAAGSASVFYGFNLISNHLQVGYGLDGNDLTTITTTGIVVGFVTFPGGMLLDYAGPIWVLIIATTLSALGALLYGLVFNGLIAASVVRFAIFCAFLNFGCISFDTGSLMAVLGSFPLNRGLVVALMKTFAGLGVSVLAAINIGFFREEYAAYMYFLTGVLVVMGSFSTFFIRFPPYHILDCEKKKVPEEVQLRRQLIEPYYLQQRPPQRRFFLGFIITFSLSIYLTTQSLCSAYIKGVSETSRTGIAVGAIVLVHMLGLMAAPLPFLGGMSVPANEALPPLPQAPELGGRLVGDKAVLDENTMMMEESNLDPQYQGTFWEDLKTPDLWLIWWNTLATWGCGLVITFNSAQIYRALNDNEYDVATNSMYSAIMGVGSAFGRLSIGFLETLILRRAPGKRPVITCIYPIASIALVLSVLLLLVLPLRSKAVIIGFFLGAFGNGSSWASTALMMRSLYAKDIGKHYNFIFSGALVAVIALNRFAYGEQFTRQARKNGTYPYCGGKACVQNALIILLCVNVTAIVASTFVHIRYRSFVKKTRADYSAEGPVQYSCDIGDNMDAIAHPPHN